jgi:murein L,D-transpeptidase YcbB/YkuD
MSKRSLAILSLTLVVTNTPLQAADTYVDPTLSPWGGQGEVATPLDATLAQSQLAALADERDRLLWLKDMGGFPRIKPTPDEGVLELGVVSPSVESLRVRLIMSNDLPESYAAQAGSLASQTFDFELMQAVQRFQTRHGMTSEGFVDARTLEALNIPVERKLEDLADSMQTWSTLAQEIGDGEPFLLVNTTEGAVRLFAAGSHQLQLKSTLRTAADEELTGNSISELSVGAQNGTAHWELGEGQLQVEHPEALVHAILYTANDWDLSTIQTAVSTAASTPIPLQNSVNVHVVALSNWADQGVVRYLDADRAKAPKHNSRPLPPTWLAEADSATAENGPRD